MNFYEDYLAFKENKYELIEFLVNKNSNVIIRFKHVLAVVDFIYDRYCSDIKITKEEEEIFQAGYGYIFDRFNLIELMLSTIFSNSKEEMEKFSKTINIILYVNDFKDEIENLDEFNTAEMSQLTEYEDSILSLLQNKEHATDVEFGLLSELSMKVFDDLGEEYYGLNEIFYDIALEYGIIDEDSFIDSETFL